MKTFLTLAAANGFVGVAAGAFGAHGLRDLLDERDLEIFEVGVRYQMLHALALIGVAWCVSRNLRCARAAGWCFAAGVVLFSGSLYALALTGVRGLGAVTPFGGLLLLAGWALLAIAARQAPDHSST